MQPYKRWTMEQLSAEIDRLRKMKKSTTKDEDEQRYYGQQIEKIADEIKERVKEHDEGS